MNTIANQSILINYTLAIDNTHFLSVTRVVLSLVSSLRVEQIFRLSNGASSRTYSSGTGELESVEPVIVLRDSVIIYQDPSQPLAPEVFNFNLGATIIGTNSTPSIEAIQREVRGRVDIVAPGKLL